MLLPKPNNLIWIITPPPPPPHVYNARHESQLELNGGSIMGMKYQGCKPSELHHIS